MPSGKDNAIPMKRARRNHRKEALKRLENHWLSERDEGEEGEFDPSSEPVITPLLKSVDGGIAYVLEALHTHDDEDARDFVEFYDSLSKQDREELTLEEIAYGAGIGSLRLAEVAQTALFLHGQMRVKMLLSAGLPRVVDTMLKQAVKPSGRADREWALKAGTILPTPKGAQIAIQNVIPPKEGAEDHPSERTALPIYVSPEDRLRTIHEAVEQRRLPAPPSPPIDLGGRLDHMQEETVELLHGEIL